MSDDDPGSGIGLDSAADDELDLTPRTGPPAGAGARRGRRANPLAWVVLGLILVGAGFVVYQGLGDATLYFRNADEAVRDREELGTSDFRLQGLVVRDDELGDGVTEFAVEFNGVEVPVRATVGLPGLFERGIPVVLEGHFAEGDEVVFLAHRILVKHDETYEAENTDRVDDAVDGQTDQP